MKKLLIILLLLLISKISFALSKAETEELINESIKTYFEPNGQKRRLSDIEGIWKSEEGIVIEVIVDQSKDNQGKEFKLYTLKSFCHPRDFLKGTVTKIDSNTYEGTLLSSCSGTAPNWKYFENSHRLVLSSPNELINGRIERDYVSEHKLTKIYPSEKSIKGALRKKPKVIPTDQTCKDGKTEYLEAQQYYPIRDQVKEDRDIGIDLLHKAYKKGCGDAAIDIALLNYDSGNIDTANKWYKAATDLGHPQGILMVGVRLAKEGKKLKGCKLIKKAEELGVGPVVFLSSTIVLETVKEKYGC